MKVSSKKLKNLIVRADYTPPKKENENTLPNLNTLN
jgi:hypothetical protein